MSKKNSSRGPNYKNDILISIIEEILPTGALMWNNVAAIYHARSCEIKARAARQSELPDVPIICRLNYCLLPHHAL